MSSADAVIEKYLGKSYQFKGRAGSTDCYGLVLSIFKDIGIDLPDISVPDDDRWHIRGKKVDLMGLPDLFTKVETPQIYDLVAFFNPKGVVNHAGVYIGGDRFIHATRKAGVCAHRLFEKQWKERLAGIYRHKDLQ